MFRFYSHSRSHLRLQGIALCLGASLILTACGGGGGGGGTPNPSRVPANTNIRDQQTPFGQQSPEQTAVGQRKFQTIADVTPAEGSVFQSTRTHRVGGVVVPRDELDVIIETSGGRTEIKTLYRAVADDTPLTEANADHVVDTATASVIFRDTYDEAEEIGASGTGSDLAIATRTRYDGGYFYLANYHASFSGQATDYASAGIWLWIEDNPSTAADYEFGAFIAPHESLYFPRAGIAGLSGTATFDGGGVGFVSVGDDYLAQIDMEVALEADFGSASALGSVTGLVNNFYVWGDDEDEEQLAGGSFILDEADITDVAGGFFTGEVMASPGAPSGYTADGNWGGQLLSRGGTEVEGIVGTLGVSGRVPDGDGGSANYAIVGTFVAGPSE